MNLSTSVDNLTFHAAISDRLAFSDHAEFRELVEQVSQSGVKTCVFDLTRLKSIDSSGLGMFMVAQEAGAEKGWRLVLKGAQGHVKDLLKLGKFDKILTLQEA